MSKRIRALERRLLDGLSERVSNYGFDPKAVGQTFYMARPFGWAAWHVAFIPHEDNDFDAVVSVGLRVDSVEELLGQVQDQSPRAVKERRRGATVGCEIGNLTRNKQRRWNVASETDLTPAAASIEEVLVEAGLPYIERFSNLETMFTVLSSNEPSAWLHCPFHGIRCSRALALAIVLDKVDHARELIIESQRFLQSQPPHEPIIFQRFLEYVRQEGILADT